MPYRCLDCGEKETFEGWATENISRTVDMNDVGEITDWGKENDGELIDSGIESCKECGSENIKDIDDSNLEEWERKHYDSKGVYHKEEIKHKIDSSGNLC